jgi:D-amino-acid dehydrogenase
MATVATRTDRRPENSAMTSQRIASTADVLIIGGGVIGLACAHYLLRSGRSVTVLDRGSIGSGSSQANCGTLTPSHAPPLAAPGMIGKALGWMLRPDAPLYIAPRFDPALWRWLWRFARRCNQRDWLQAAQAKAALLHASRTLIETLVRDEQMDCEFAADGVLYAIRDSRVFEETIADRDALADLGIPSEVWSAATLREREPALRDDMVGGMWLPGDASLRPDRYVAELARIVRAAGGTIIEDCAVTGFRRDGARIVAVATMQPGIGAGEINPRDIVLATGAWSPLFAKQLGIALPIQPGKGYSITYDAPALMPRRPLLLKERSVCVTAWGSGFRLGSTMEFSGFDERLNRTRLDALERASREYLREPVGPVKREEWFGWRPMTWDDLPILGRAPGSENLWLATGHGMLGVSMSAITGLLLSEIICGRTPSLDMAPYSAQRFQ